MIVEEYVYLEGDIMDNSGVFTERDLAHYRVAMEEIREKVESLLKDFLDGNPDFDYFDKGRIKDSREIVEKLQRKCPNQKEFSSKLVIDTITDIAGLRVIFGPKGSSYNIEYLDKTLDTLEDINYLRDMMVEASMVFQNTDVDIIYRFVETLKNSGLNIVDGKDKDYISEPKNTGYMSYHIVVLASNGYPVEIQLRNLIQHLYAQAEHKRYKGVSDEHKNAVLAECIRYLSPDVRNHSL